MSSPACESRTAGLYALPALSVPAGVNERCEQSQGWQCSSLGILTINSHDRTFLVRIRGPYAPRVGVMVMIDLVAEKKSLGFSSVTQVTEALLTGYLPYTPLGT